MLLIGIRNYIVRKLQKVTGEPNFFEEKK